MQNLVLNLDMFFTALRVSEGLTEISLPKNNFCTHSPKGMSINYVTGRGYLLSLNRENRPRQVTLRYICFKKKHSTKNPSRMEIFWVKTAHNFWVPFWGSKKKYNRMEKVQGGFASLHLSWGIRPQLFKGSFPVLSFLMRIIGFQKKQL